MCDSDLKHEIEDYGAKVKNAEVACDLRDCPLCCAEKVRFWRNGFRVRLFLVIVEHLVERVDSCLSCWKCSVCGRGLTLYPDFALPYKHYVGSVIVEHSRAYVEEESRGYRRCVREGKLCNCYPETSDDKPAAELAHTTLYRWVTTLGGLSMLLRKALDLIRHKDPARGVARDLGRLRIASGKFKSRSRRSVLKGCAELLVTDRAYRLLFDVSALPDLATACGWR